MLMENRIQEILAIYQSAVVLKVALFADSEEDLVQGGQT